MTSTYILEVDSSERDPVTHPNPGEYTVRLNRPLYNVTQIDLASARIPVSQHLINSGNNTFEINSIHTITLDEGTWSSGADLAASLTTQLVNFDGSGNDLAVTYSTTLKTLTFTHSAGDEFEFKFYTGTNGYTTSSATGTPAHVLGFAGSDIASSDSGVLTSGVIDLTGVPSIIVSLSSGADEFNTDIFVNGGTFSFDSLQFNDTSGGPLQSTYVGRVFTNGQIGNVMNYKYRDDPVQHVFHRGPEKQIEELTVRFYYNNGTKLIPYDFNNRNHILKFEIRCSLDKFKNLESEDKSVPLPPPVELETKPRYTKQQRIVYLVVGIALVVGLVILALFKR